MQRDFFLRDARKAARDLLGCRLVNGERQGIIVETEAYLEDDPASHSRRGPTRRCASMYLEGGHAYVYLIYGIHHCFNVVTGEEGRGEAVLIRACKPLAGLEAMRRSRYGEKGVSRPPRPDYALCSGPGRLCAAFGISREAHDGVRIGRGGLCILPGIAVPDEQTGCSRRIGLSPGRGEDLPYRWFVSGSLSVSPPHCRRTHRRN